MIKFLTVIAMAMVLGCTKSEVKPETSKDLYFPSKDDWETIEPKDLNWNTSKINDLDDILINGKTRGFILLKGGKIVIEKYFGKDILNLSAFDKNKQWYWASAGKTLTVTLVGIAEQENKLELLEPSSKYLGENWTSLTPNQEKNISILNHLSMTTGLDDAVSNSDSFDPQNLKFKSDAGTRWAYHNAPYTLLDKVVENATQMDFDNYFDQKIASKIGMDGTWRWVENNHVFFSTPRSMARFGLTILNNGKWNEEEIINQVFVQAMINTSQDLNKSYGYLWWLNGKESFKLPQTQQTFNGSLVSNAPADMVMGIGKNGQYLCVVPSQNIVMIRMGESPDNLPVSTIFLNQIWGVLNQIIPK